MSISASIISASIHTKLATLPEQLFRACMQLLERGVADYGVEVCTLSLESIEGVASSQRAESQSLGGVVLVCVCVYLRACVHVIMCLLHLPVSSS